MAEPTQPTSTPAPRRRRLMDDKLSRWLVIGIFAVIALWLSAVVAMLVFGMTDRSAPRTHQERQLYLLEAVVKESPRSAQAWADYVRALALAKQYSAAQRAADTGLKAAKEKSLITVRLAAMQYDRGKMDEASKLVDEAIKQADKERAADRKMLNEKGVETTRIQLKGLLEAYMLKSRILTDQAKWKDVVVISTKALKVEPAATDFLAIRGDAYAALGDKKKAAADYKEALRFVPDYEPALTGLEEIGASSK